VLLCGEAVALGTGGVALLLELILDVITSRFPRRCVRPKYARTSTLEQLAGLAAQRRDLKGVSLRILGLNIVGIHRGFDALGTFGTRAACRWCRLELT
jgi:hypothetical protein